MKGNNKLSFNLAFISWFRFWNMLYLCLQKTIPRRLLNPMNLPLSRSGKTSNKAPSSRNDKGGFRCSDIKLKSTKFTMLNL